MPYENLTNYTEVDVAANRLAVTALTATVTGLDRDESVSLYKDFGVGFFDGLDFHFKFRRVDAAGTSQGGVIAATANIETGYGGLATTDILLEAYSTTRGLRLVRGNFVAFDGSIALSNGVDYYCVMTRADGNTSASVLIYSDASETTLVDTITVTGYSTATWQHLYAMLARNDGTTAVTIDYTVSNISLDGVVVSGGAWWKFF